MNATSNPSWIEEALNKLTESKEFQARIKDEDWTSLPLPIYRGREIGVALYFGSTRRAPDGVREPIPPHYCVFLAYPTGVPIWSEVPQNTFPVTSFDLRSLRDPTAIEAQKQASRGRGKAMAKHKQLVDTLLINGWLSTMPPKSGKLKDVGTEWKTILSQLVQPHFAWFYSRAAKELIDTLDRIVE